jgi:hypothetical protein
VFGAIACIGRIAILDTVADVRRVNKGEVPSPSPEKEYSEVSLKLSVGTCIIVSFLPTEGITVSVDGGIRAARGRSLVLSVV